MQWGRQLSIVWNLLANLLGREPVPPRRAIGHAVLDPIEPSVDLLSGHEVRVCQVMGAPKALLFGRDRLVPALALPAAALERRRVHARPAVQLGQLALM